MCFWCNFFFSWSHIKKYNFTWTKIQLALIILALSGIELFSNKGQFDEEEEEKICHAIAIVFTNCHKAMLLTAKKKKVKKKKNKFMWLSDFETRAVK